MTPQIQYHDDSSEWMNASLDGGQADQQLRRCVECRRPNTHRGRLICSWTPCGRRRRRRWTPINIPAEWKCASVAGADGAHAGREPRGDCRVHIKEMHSRWIEPHSRCFSTGQHLLLLSYRSPPNWLCALAITSIWIPVLRDRKFWPQFFRCVSVSSFRPTYTTLCNNSAAANQQSSLTCHDGQSTVFIVVSRVCPVHF